MKGFDFSSLTVEHYGLLALAFIGFILVYQGIKDFITVVQDYMEQTKKKRSFLAWYILELRWEKFKVFLLLGVGFILGAYTSWQLS